MVWEYVGEILRLMVLAGLGIAGVLAVLIWKRNRSTRVTFLRFVIQLVALAAIFYIFSYSEIIPLLYELLILFGMSLFLGRFFCGWLCPLGLILDLEIFLRKALKKRHHLIPDRLNIALHKSRYIIFLVFLLLPIVLWVLDPPNPAYVSLMAQKLAGPFRPLSVLLDPMIPFIVPWTGAAGEVTIGPLNLSFPYAQDIITYTGEGIGQIVAIVFVVLVLLGGWFVRRFWCRFCPTGISLAAVNRFKGFKWAPFLYVDKNEEKCTKCGVCKRVCQLQVNEVYEQKGGKIMTQQCMVCARCIEMCPYEDALQLKLGNKTLFRSRNWLEPSTSE
ncbi:MAG: 4Fe-4S binding protein [Candidatus Bathyarchaeota archaeon]|nr:4Fe-4S binding protein [Candidatus Bathyarchaeota archaeon]